MEMSVAVPTAAISEKIDKICNFIYVIEKKLRVPTSDVIIYNDTTQFEEAYLAEDRDKKGPFNLLIKIGTEEGVLLGKKIKDMMTTGKNVEFKLKRITQAAAPAAAEADAAPAEPAAAEAGETAAAVTKLTNINISYRINNDSTEELKNIYIHELNNVNVEWLDKTDDKDIYSHIYVLDTERTKTGTKESLKAIVPGIYTPVQIQQLEQLEPEVMKGLNAFLGDYENKKTEIDIYNDKLKKAWSGITLFTKTTNKDNASGSIMVLLKYFKPDIEAPGNSFIRDDSLITKIKNHRNILGFSNVYFKINEGRYKNMKSIIENIAGAYRQEGIRRYINEKLSGNQVKDNYIGMLEYIGDLDDALNNSTKNARMRESSLFGKMKLFPKNIFKPTPAFGGSIKYQQKRYKVYEREDGAKYINLDKKKYTLKVSSKGTYITRDGKRQYL